MEQNIIAIVWDFDKTLTQGYMQEPLFNHYKVDSEKFWEEVNNLPEKYKEDGVIVNKDTVYLNHMLTCVEQGIFTGLNNKLLEELGKELVFYDGVLEIFQELINMVGKDEEFKKFGITVEHYIVSTGLTAMIKGSEIFGLVENVWGCEFIEEVAKSELEIKVSKAETPAKVIRQIGSAIDNTSKTRAIFEINKGTNKYSSIEVNSKIAYENRRVPFEYMIYIVDGPSDVPVFSLLQKSGGKTLGVYPRGNAKAFRQVNQLQEEGRINAFAEADYSKDTTAYMWLTDNVRKIAQKIYDKKITEISGFVSKPPTHITD